MNMSQLKSCTCIADVLVPLKSVYQRPYTLAVSLYPVCLACAQLTRDSGFLGPSGQAIFHASVTLKGAEYLDLGRQFTLLRTCIFPHMLSYMDVMVLCSFCCCDYR